MSTWLPIAKGVLSVALLAMGVFYLDFRSLLLEMKRNREGQGSSGVPLVALPVYVVGVWLLPQYVFGQHKGILFLALLILHSCCHFIIPRIHRLITMPRR